MREGLAPSADEIEFALIFGSVAAGNEEVASDVDVLVVGSVSLAMVVKETSAVSGRLRREVNPVVMTLEDFKAKIAPFCLQAARSAEYQAPRCPTNSQTRPSQSCARDGAPRRRADYGRTCGMIGRPGA